VSAKVRSTQPNVLSQFIIDQQGPPWQGALFAQRQVDTTLNANGWQMVSLSMCEAHTANSTVSAYFGSQTPGAAVFVDDLTMSMVDDPVPWNQGGCGNVPVTPPVPPNPPTPPDGAHYFENGTPTTIDVADNANKCLTTAGTATLDRNACMIVIPYAYGPGWYLEVAGSGGNCFGKISGTLQVGVVPCRSSSNMVRDDVVISDGPGEYNLAFPIRKAKLAGSPPEDYDKCLTLNNNVAVFSPCGAVPASNQMWFDAADIRAYSLAPASKPATLTRSESFAWDQLALVYDVAKDSVETFQNQAPSASMPGRAATLAAMPSLFGKTLQQVLLRCHLSRDKCIGVAFQIFNFAHWAVQLDVARRVNGGVQALDKLECTVPGTQKRVDVVAGTCVAPGSFVEIKADTVYSLAKGIEDLTFYEGLYANTGMSVLRGIGAPWPTTGNTLGFQNPYMGATQLSYRAVGNGVYAYTFDPSKLVALVTLIYLLKNLQQSYRDLAGQTQPFALPEVSILTSAINAGAVGSYVAILTNRGMSSMNAWVNASFQFTPQQISSSLANAGAASALLIIILWGIAGVLT
jgi:hypothetical protein